MNYLQGWSEVIISLLLLVIYLANYFLYGFAFAKILKKKEKSIMLCMISGFFITALYFCIYVLPLKVNVISLNVISYIWIILWSITTMAIVIWCRRELINDIKVWRGKVAKHKVSAMIFIGITCVQLIFEELYGRYTCGNGAAYFNGYVSSALFENKLGTVSPYSGRPLKEFAKSYFLQTYNDHSAVVAYLTKLSPLIETRTIMATIVIIIGNMIIYKIGEAIFPKKKKSQLVFFVLYMTFMGMWVPCVYNPSYYYYFRAFEGKTIFGMLLIPFVILCIWKLYDAPDDRYIQGILFIGLLGSYTFCMSTMYILPFIFICYAPMILENRKMFKNICLGLIPCIAVMIYYVLVTKEVITLSIM